MIDPDRPQPHFVLTRFLVLSLTLGLTLSLGFAVFSVPPAPVQLVDTIQANMHQSGVTNPVTAVLLNFRGYDTLLEIGVLLVAVFGIGTLRSPDQRRRFSVSAPGPILLALVRLLVPVMVLVAGYFLWAGAHAPGGAFQAGAVLGAAGVLILLSNLALSTWFRGWPFRAVLVMGFALFLGVGLGAMATNGHFLEYPREWANHLILLVEAALTVSIGLTLAALYLDSPDARDVTKEHP